MKPFDEYLDNLKKEVTSREPKSETERGYRMAIMMIDAYYKRSNNIPQNPIIKDWEQIKSGKDVSIDVNNKIMRIHTKMYDVMLYTYCKNIWKDNPYLIKYKFPIYEGIPIYPDNGWKIYGLSNLIQKPRKYEELTYGNTVNGRSEENI